MNTHIGARRLIFAAVTVGAAIPLLLSGRGDSSSFTTASLPARVEAPPALTGGDPTIQTEHDILNLEAAYAVMGVTPATAGNGVRVGVIDSGIAVFTPDSTYPTNPCFSDAAYTAAGRLGETQFTNNKVVVARVFGYPPVTPYPGADPTPGSTADAQSPHGSHVAGIIACNPGTAVTLNGMPMQIEGVAPAATLGSYNVFPGPEIEGVGPSDQMIAAAIDAATADGMKVINLSLEAGSASPETQAALGRAWANGVIPVVAAGNSGPTPGTVGIPSNNLNAISVGSVNSGRSIYALVESGGIVPAGSGTVKVTALGAVGDDITVKVTLTGQLYALTAGANQLDTSIKPKAKSPSGLGFGCNAAAYPAAAAGKVVLVARGRCYFAAKVKAAKRAGAIGVLIVNRDDSLIEPAATTDVPDFPGTVIALTPGRQLMQVALAGGRVTVHAQDLYRTDDEGALSGFSAVGPATNHVNKPDVIAPGGGILSAVTDETCVKPSTGCFALYSGTSMAAPMVVGVLALVEQYHPDWSAAMVRSAVLHTARTQPGLLVSQQGVGLVDAAAALTAPIGFASTQLVLNPGATGNLTVLNPYDVVKTVTLKVVPSDGITKDTALALGMLTFDIPARGQVDVPVVSTGGSGVAKIQASVDGVTINTVVSVR